MTTYDFSVVLRGEPELTVDLADRLFSAGCDDSTPSQRANVVTVHFSREAESLETAIRSAIADVASAGCVAARVEIDADAAPLKT